MGVSTVFSSVHTVARTAHSWARVVGGAAVSLADPHTSSARRLGQHSPAFHKFTEITGGINHTPSSRWPFREGGVGRVLWEQRSEYVRSAVSKRSMG